jgi:hypothetical protein
MMFNIDAADRPIKFYNIRESFKSNINYVYFSNQLCGAESILKSRQPLN